MCMTETQCCVCMVLCLAAFVQSQRQNPDSKEGVGGWRVLLSPWVLLAPGKVVNILVLLKQSLIVTLRMQMQLNTLDMSEMIF